MLERDTSYSFYIIQYVCETVGLWFLIHFTYSGFLTHYEDLQVNPNTLKD